MKELEYTKKRVGFVIIDGKVIFQEDDNRIPTLKWMENDLHLTREQIESTIRGGTFRDRINFCVGSNYSPVDLTKVSMKNLMEILEQRHITFPRTDYRILNGFIIGQVGEDWKPIQDLGSYYTIECM